MSDHPLALMESLPTPAAEQLSEHPAWGQVLFDLFFGAVVPIICLIFDPFVLRRGEFGDPFLIRYAAGAWTVILLGMTSLLHWLTFRRWPVWQCGFMCGIAVYVLILGVILLPFSFLGLFFDGIGWLGLSPFFTAVVFRRNSIRARAETSLTPGAGRWCRLVPGFLAALLIPVIAQAYVNSQIANAMKELESGQVLEESRAERTLLRLRHFVDSEQILKAYSFSSNDQSRKILSKVYEEIRGRDLKKELYDRETDPDHF
jgi:hypothetical protein